MGFFLTVVYIAFALLSPADLAPSLAEYRVQMVVAILALLFSAQSIFTGRFLRSPQVYILAGLLPAVFLSQAIGGSWFGGGLVAIGRLVPLVVAFYLILLNCETIERFKLLASVLAVIAAIYVLQGGKAYLSNDLGSPLLMVYQNSSGEVLLRMRGLGILNDPNDLAQFLVLVIPFFWLLWEDGRMLRNILVVVVPTVFFIAGIYMTHSRGGAVALLVILMFGLKDRLGTIAAALGSALAYAGFLLLDFSGGRAVSVEAGSDRIAFWGTGLQLFKSSPIFGIGMGNFVNQNGGHTAHNSFVLCLAELGIVGYMLWTGLLVSTFSGLNSCIAALQPPQSECELASRPTDERVDRDQAKIGSGLENVAFDDRKEEIWKWARMLRISLFGFIAAACFLSRTYALTLYVSLAMAVALCWLEPAEDGIAEQPLSRLISSTAMFGFGAIVVLYAVVRIHPLF